MAIGHSLFGHVALAWRALVSAGGEPLPPRSGGERLYGYDGLVLLAANVWLPQRNTTYALVGKARLSLLVAAAWRRGYLPARRGIGSAQRMSRCPICARLGRWLRRTDWTAQNGHSCLADLGGAGADLERRQRR